MSDRPTPHVVMVKKRLGNGEPCRKCLQAEEMLRRRGLWEVIDEVVVADESDDNSAGMLLAKQHGIEVAPFFIARADGEEQIFDSAVKVAKLILSPKKAALLQRVDSNQQVEVAVSDADVTRAAVQLSEGTPQDILDWALSRLNERCAIAFSGAEDVVLIDMAVKSGHRFSVFCLDTGRLHPQTYRFIDTVRQFYGVDISVRLPEPSAVDDLVRRKGLFSFYEDGHGECCGVRKIEPLRRTLAQFDGWITGQRRDQSPTRADVPLLDWDRAHRTDGMLKANPLAHWSQSQLWDYIRDQGVPYNELHEQGFISIGCEPCTRASRPGEHERAARWWWEDATKRECGLHVKE